MRPWQHQGGFQHELLVLGDPVHSDAASANQDYHGPLSRPPIRPEKWVDSRFPRHTQPWSPMTYVREARRMFPKTPFRFAWHHLSHASAAFAASPFEQAAFLCLDGKGEDISASIGIATGKRTKILYELPCENGLGLLYT